MRENAKCEANTPKKALRLEEFTINGDTYLLPPAFYLVSDLKRLAGIHPSHQFAINLATGPHYLDDNECIRVDGSEEFESFAACGTAA
ncbi:MAG: hypothetical protein CME70_03075 [Halobacteriovorax sp.]|nr:hypothetical protein [Halobacteriovorax sp.]